jgi:hypothetical protein
MEKSRKMKKDDFVYNFVTYGEEEKSHKKFFNISKFFKNEKKEKKNQKVFLPKFFSMNQDRELRLTKRNFFKSPYQNFKVLLKKYSQFIIQNNSFLLKTFIKINDSIFLELLKIFNFYTAISIQAMIKTYISLHMEIFITIYNYIKSVIQYWYYKLRFWQWK